MVGQENNGLKTIVNTVQLVLDHSIYIDILIKKTRQRINQDMSYFDWT